ncbi:MAG: hypothetical protein L0Y57_11175 [Beijerinckiaceae bacterium]|nr:hypothetical protein [Beijerinckiaceae bacterium]
MSVFDLRFDQLLNWFGWIPGAILFIAAAIGLVAVLRSPQPAGLLTLSALVIFLAVGGLLFLPEAPRIAKAFLWLAWPPARPVPSGSLAVGTAGIILSPGGASDAPVIAQIWYPAAKGRSHANLPSQTAAPLPCPAFMDSEVLSGEHPQYPVILYAPGNGGGRTDSASTAAELASHSYVVLAIDDIDRDPPSRHPGEEIAQPLAFDFSSAAALEKTLSAGDRKVRRQAEKAMQALNLFESCANGDWRARVRFDRIGFLGFSFGGSTAAEAGTLDGRVAAVVNLDGWLFGQAARGALDKPYMIILIEDAVFPDERRAESPNSRKRYEAVLTARDLREEVRLANQPDGYGFRILRSFHENLSDQIFSRDYFKKWLIADVYRVKSILNAYLLAFFDSYLRDNPSPLLGQTRSPFRGVETLKGNEVWLSEAAQSALRSPEKPD